ncbi:hypothetical protein I215_01848 [Galbibacter marinus]|uniref:Uncharacterized protein n=1 Tax=Galbibacter marinus TaxID=555500 RepID=K2Q600_9FLAO|nr:hypothetical protein [Galbibacter marinus]EKF56226.1 hypothetical protein I215_01848 [Galbibacter marinus]
MESIEKWFETLDYNNGVIIYKSLPSAKVRIIQKLERGKSNHNMAQLIKELRLYKSSIQNRSPKPSISTKPKAIPKLTTDKEISIFHKKKALKEASQESIFGSVQYGSLPPELRIRYKDAAQLFYQMCDLKFALNDLDAGSQDHSLSIQLQIEDLDTKREHIWKELHHWQNHKTFLPSSSEVFDDLTPGELFKKRNNLRSQVTKLKKRIDAYYIKVSTETDKHKIRLVERQINRSEKKLHQHTLNIDKINDLL